LRANPFCTRWIGKKGIDSGRLPKQHVLRIRKMVITEIHDHKKRQSYKENDHASSLNTK
jgi:hypothetical protein